MLLWCRAKNQKSSKHWIFTKLGKLGVTYFELSSDPFWPKNSIQDFSQEKLFSLILSSDANETLRKQVRKLMGVKFNQHSKVLEKIRGSIWNSGFQDFTSKISSMFMTFSFSLWIWLLYIQNFCSWQICKPTRIILAKGKYKTFLMLCAIWYHLHNLKNVKNTHGVMLILVKLQAEAYNSKCHTPLWLFQRFFQIT